MDTHLGTSGYSYDDWQGRFYPKNLQREEWLSFYATKFDTVELNVTFYRTPPKKAFEGWYSRTPDNFHFVIKGSRFITHLKRLKEVEEPLGIFFAAATPLKEKLKVVLWQLPPRFGADLTRLQRFLEALRPHQNIRHAFEFRDKSWFSNKVYDMLRSRNAALVFSDHPFEIIEPSTADFLYIRRHGPGGQYHIEYSDRDLTKDAALIQKYGMLTYEFFNNDARAAAVRNALELKKMLQQ